MEMTSLFWVFDFSFILAMRLGDGGRVPKARLGIFEFYSEFCSLFGVFGMNFLRVRPSTVQAGALERASRPKCF